MSNENPESPDGISIPADYRLPTTFNFDTAKFETPESQSRSQIEIWRSKAESEGELTQVVMNEEKSVPQSGTHCFFTNGLHGCGVFVELKDGTAHFGHLDAKKLMQDIERFKDMGESSSSLILIPDIPELNSIQGSSVIRYHLELNYSPDGFAEGMALQESPHLQSACVVLERQPEGGYSGYINAFERTMNAKWYISGLPQQVAQKIELTN